MLFLQSADTSSPGEDDALRLNCTAAAIEEFPKWPLDSFQRAKGGMALNFAIAIYLIMALGVICDDYFVPVLEMICDALKVSTIQASSTLIQFTPGWWDGLGMES